MAISYPISLPTNHGFAQVEFRAVNAVAYSQSPFTFAGQAIAHPGQMWQADVTLPPMRRADAEQWIAALLSLRGRLGTFLLGDPLSTGIRGTAVSASITGAIGENTVSATVSAGQTLLAGDMFQLGSGSGATLHKVLQNYTGSGSASDLEIWPSLRSSVTSAAADLTSPQGLFRLVSNETSWSVDQAAIYGISFSAMEAV